MITLSYDNIILTFQQLSGCTVDNVNDNLSIIDNAKFCVENILNEKLVTTADMPRCEYAAAALAFYDFICKQAAQERIIVTASGNAAASESFSEKIKAVQQLKNSALNNLRGLVLDSDFYFKTTEG